ncbi:phospholipase domain-containing protein [Cupriavidus basilensis]
MINTGAAGLHLHRHARLPTATTARGPSRSRRASSLTNTGRWRLQGNWYDFVVTTTQGSFRRRFAGRLETGADGVSDPALGKPARAVP